MLNQLFNLTRPLIVPDVETTGTDKNARIVEIGFQMWTSEGMTKEWRSLVNPGVPIPEAATKVHGITDAVIRGCREGCNLPPSAHGLDAEVCKIWKPWPTFPQLAPNLDKGFTDVDFAGKNVRFDLRVIAHEFQLAGIEWGYANARIIDAERLEQLGEPRSLSNLYRKHTGKEPIDAHQALSDVRMTTEVIEAQLKKYQALPRDLELLHAAQWPGWLCDSGQFKMINGIPTCCFGKKWNGRAMRDINPSYYDWIVREDFPQDVKELARQAKLGKFPVSR